MVGKQECFVVNSQGQSEQGGWLVGGEFLDGIRITLGPNVYIFRLIALNVTHKLIWKQILSVFNILNSKIESKFKT